MTPMIHIFIGWCRHPMLRYCPN